METNILFLLVGWLLGILSPLIVEHVKRRYQKEEVKRGILTELKELRPRMAGTVYILATRLGKLDRDLLEWISNVFQEYESSEPKEGMIKGIRNLLKLTDQQLSALSQAVQFKPGGGLSLKTYSLPFLDANMGLLPMFPVEFQSRIIEIRAQIWLLNQEIEEAKFFYGKTFDSGLSQDNHKIIVSNIQQKYQIIEGAARRIADKISGLFPARADRGHS